MCNFFSYSMCTYSIQKRWWENDSKIISFTPYNMIICVKRKKWRCKNIELQNGNQIFCVQLFLPIHTIKHIFFWRWWKNIKGIKWLSWKKWKFVFIVFKRNCDDCMWNSMAQNKARLTQICLLYSLLRSQKTYAIGLDWRFEASFSLGHSVKLSML